MACHVVIAVRSPEDGKQRLAGSLSQLERVGLNFNMFRHVFKTISETCSPDRIIVVSRSAPLRAIADSAGAHGLLETGETLNAALAQGASYAIDQGATALLSISSDLPWLEAADILALLNVPTPIAIATDRERSGTNALFMRPAAAIPYRYGVGSLAAHLREAGAAGLEATIVERPGLARDVDTPADLDELRRRPPLRIA